MMKLPSNCRLFLLLALLPTGIVHCQETPPSQVPEPGPAILTRAHAHNDYEHKRPLLDALDRGFGSVEADIFLTPHGLLVAHSIIDLNPERTLEKLYLDLLQDRARRNGGWLFGAGQTFYLMIDVKSNAEATYRALEKVLIRYSDLLTVTNQGNVTTKAVTVILSGNRATDLIARQPVRYVAIDGRPEDLETNVASQLVPWISARWASLFRWQGDGPMPDDEKRKLVEFVERAHHQGRQVRFWATAERESLWQELIAAGVDRINTDQLDRLQTFLVNSLIRGPSK